MNAKGSKNAIENRGAKSVMICAKCGEERKPIRVMTMGSNKMGYECKCGLLNKVGDILA
jgi:hypothetical protein